MADPLTYVVVAIGGAALGAVGRKVGDLAFDVIRARLPFLRKSAHHLSGQWYAAWQTTVEHAENVNTELVHVDHRGDKLIMTNVAKSPENKVGGYLWRATLTIYDNAQAVGLYVSTEPNVRSKGTLYLVLNRVGTIFRGQWVGCNYDYIFTSGYGVIARDRDIALAELDRLLTAPALQLLPLITDDRNSL